MQITQASSEALAALGLGFAFAGLLASGAELAIKGPLSFRALQGRVWAALASVPVLVLSGPFLILRHTIREGRTRKRPVLSAFGAAVVAGLWSLMSGRLVFDLAQRLSGA